MASGDPSVLTVMSDQAAALIVDSQSHITKPLNRAKDVFMAHGRAGTGKFLAAAHNGWFSFETEGSPNLAQFWKSALNWGRATTAPAPRVGCFPECPSIAASIQASSAYFTVDGDVTQFAKSDVKANSSADTAYDVAAVRSWLEAGGTAVVVSIDWVWVQYDSGLLSNDPANLLLKSYGVLFDDVSVSSPTTSVTTDIYTTNLYYDVKDLAGDIGAIDFTNTLSASYTKFATIASNVKNSLYGVLNTSSEFGAALLNLSTICTIDVDWTILPIHRQTSRAAPARASSTAFATTSRSPLTLSCRRQPPVP
ncbi:hypothetical protein HK405_001025, partial [Cladochytrium tenue]